MRGKNYDTFQEISGLNYEYKIYTHKTVSMIGGAFFICWWFFLAYVVLISRKNALIDYIISYIIFFVVNFGK